MVELYSVEYFILLFAGGLLMMAGFYVNMKGHNYIDRKLRWTGIGIAFIGVVGVFAMAILAFSDMLNRI